MDSKQVPSDPRMGKRLHNHGKIHDFLIRKLPISMAVFNRKLLNYHRATNQLETNLWDTSWSSNFSWGTFVKNPAILSHFHAETECPAEG